MRRHEWGPSTVGHGEQQCIHCLVTNREAAVIAPEFCIGQTDVVKQTVHDYFAKEIDYNTAITVLVVAGLSGHEARAKLANT